MPLLNSIHSIVYHLLHFALNPTGPLEYCRKVTYFIVPDLKKVNLASRCILHKCKKLFVKTVYFIIRAKEKNKYCTFGTLNLAPYKCIKHAFARDTRDFANDDIISALYRNNETN